MKRSLTAAVGKSTYASHDMAGIAKFCCAAKTVFKAYR